ncbi:MAG: DNA polymerase I [Proteobacteria bacterium]|nr:DNA polymerase I [Pseudomonadota bacterium]
MPPRKKTRKPRNNLVISTHALKRAAPVDDNDRKNELFLIDGSGFIFRAFHALPPLTRADGTPVNAVLGFTNMLVKFVTDMHVPNIAVIFDAKRKNFRNDIYPEYKANRTETPPELIPQFPLIRAATEAFSIPSIEMEGYEADDLIATYAKLAHAKGIPVAIVSSDKDLMQLICPGVRMIDPMKYKDIGPDEVMEKFGVTPDKVTDVQALAGDSSDNIPGVPGIGVKTAAQLINEYGDLETLLKRASEIKQQKRREALTENAELARISKKLVLLDDHVKVPIGINDLKIKQPDTEKLFRFLTEQGFKSVLARMEKQFGPGHEKPATSHITTAKAAPVPGYELIQDEKSLQRWITAATAAGIVSADTETTSLTPAKAKLVGISMSTAEGNGCYIPLQHRNPEGYSESFDFSMKEKVPAAELKQIPLEKALRLLKPMLEDPSILKVGHNIKYDMQLFSPYGIHISPIDDTMLLSYTLDGTSHGNGMDELAQIFLNHDTIKYEDVTGSGKSQVTFDLVPLDKALQYAAEDADITLRLHKLFKPRLAQEHMATVYETLERPLAPVIAEIETTGIKIDVKVLKGLSGEFAKNIATLETEIYDLAGHGFNVGSPKQLGDVLFGEMGLSGGKKTKTGAWSTSVDVLEELSEQGHTIVDKILDWRELSKLKNTYADALPEAINPKTGRLHTSFFMAGTNTGRLSSSDPNLQNIPIKSENGKKIRAAFVPEKGYTLLSVDYSQVELRIAAELGDIKALKQAFHDGVDIHAATASQVFGVPLDQMTPDIRRQAKAINFGIIYGISGFGLAKQLGIPQAAAAEYIKKYFARIPELKKFMDDAKEYARKHGYVKTFYGRKCFVRGINDKNAGIRNFAERQAINAPLQGTAADIMKRAMIAMKPALAEAKLGARMLLQVHDELLFEVPLKEKDTTEILVKKIMESAGQGIGVPLHVEAGWGDNWADAH